MLLTNIRFYNVHYLENGPCQTDAKPGVNELSALEFIDKLGLSKDLNHYIFKDTTVKEDPEFYTEDMLLTIKQYAYIQ